MKISQKEVEEVALVARLNLTEEEIQENYQQLNKILESMEVLEQVDTSNVEPLIHILPIKNVLREDEKGSTLSIEKVLQNAPEAEDRMFKVPKIM